MSPVVEVISRCRSGERRRTVISQEIARIVPGDVCNYYLGTSAHIAIVAEVKWYDDGRVKDVRLIEATFGYNELGTKYAQTTIKNRSLASDYPKAGKERYSIVRLRR